MSGHMSPYVDRYRITATIGAGAHGSVYRARDPDDGEDYVIKRQRLASFDEGIGVCVLRESALLRQLEGAPNIVHLHAVVPEPPYLYLVLEHMDMDLAKCMGRYARHGMPTAAIQSVMLQLLRALAFCHARNIIHRDVKPQNVLVDASGRVKLADFGLARQTRDNGESSTPEVVTLWYRAPELILGEVQYGGTLDLWSAGCILAELCTGKTLFPGGSEVDMLRMIFHRLGTPTEANFPGVASLPNFSPEFPRWHEAGQRHQCGWQGWGVAVPMLQSLALRATELTSSAVPSAILRAALALGPQRTREEVDLLSSLVVYEHHRLTAQQAIEHEYFADCQNRPPFAWTLYSE